MTVDTERQQRAGIARSMSLLFVCVAACLHSMVVEIIQDELAASGLLPLVHATWPPRRVVARMM